jgi:3-deoxy-7-phosphoheptulonate synthase
VTRVLILVLQVSDKMDPQELVKVCRILNPENRPGRLTVIVRMGADKLREKLPALIAACQNEEVIVTWVSDPMHGNTVKTPNGFKTRPFEAIRNELRAFFDVHSQMGSHAGGVHLEMTGQVGAKRLCQRVLKFLPTSLSRTVFLPFVF